MNDVVKEVRDLLQTSMGTRCLAYYAGNIGLPFKASLPCLMVRERSTEVIRKSTAADQYKFSLSILVVTDIVVSFNEAGLTDRIVKHREALRLIMEEKDTTGAPKTDTVLGCLMKQSNIRGVSFIYNLNPRVNYEVESPGETFYVAAEVLLDFTTTLVTRTA